MFKIISRSLTTGMIWVLMLAILGIACVSAGIMLPAILELFRHDYASAAFNHAIKNDGLKYLSSFVISCGALVALFTYLREKDRQGKEREERRSRFFFEQAKAGLEEVCDLLKDQNNDRSTWIRVARDLLYSISLSKQITVPEYIEAYRLLEEKIRHKLIAVLSVKDEDTGAWSALPPQFFYGLKDWPVPRSLDEAATLACQTTHSQAESIDTVFRYERFAPLGEQSIVAIYDFLEYPKEYVDPLKAVTIWDDDWVNHHGLDEGAAKFICHRRLVVTKELEKFVKPHGHIEDTTR
ncbi:MAG: hypothetical protein ACLP5H_05090 [Desulfomonilaceae bacterium]